MRSISMTLIESWTSTPEEATFDMRRGPHPCGSRYVGKAEVGKGLATRLTGIDVHYGEDRHWVGGNRGVSDGSSRGSARRAKH